MSDLFCLEGVPQLVYHIEGGPFERFIYEKEGTFGLARSQYFHFCSKVIQEKEDYPDGNAIISE